MFNLLRGGLAVLAAVLLFAGPDRLAAQDANRVYSLGVVTSPPKVRSELNAAQVISRSYPDAMRAVGGRVQLRFVVKADGKVDSSTIEVMAASTTQIAEAATKAVQQIEFQPAQLNGVAVNAVVIFPITYAIR